MNAIIPYAMWACFIIGGLGILAIIGFGIRNLTYGKMSSGSVIVMVIPLAIWLVLGLVIGEWVRASLLAVMVAGGLAVLALVYTGIRRFILQ
jgi:hypothetical protein